MIAIWPEFPTLYHILCNVASLGFFQQEQESIPHPAASVILMT